ncbi:unnamed protein product [Alopecurus aequalis]
MEPNVLEHILDGREKPTNLPLALLKDITAHFSEEREIGHGGFATVYKGVLPNGNVAVKRIRSGHTINEKLFHREVNSLLTINHPNIVRFLGFCASTDQTAIKIEGLKEHIYAEIRERLLCFEYISNGNLQKHITDELRGLDWSTRYQIIKGMCDGLHYLHMEKHIYHMDLKPANILLDNDMVPMITDFGLSRLDEKSQTMSVDRPGTLGYCAPEYIRRGKMSFKSDIYSLGTIITELVTGEKCVPDNNINNVLRRWRHRWRKTGKESPLGYQQVTKCIDIGLRCQEIDPYNRPSIWEILCDINEMEGTNSQTSYENESTVGQISPYLDDDILGVEPLELHFPFGLNTEISCLLQLTNDTDSSIAFEVQKMSPLPYCIEPYKGIIRPHSKRDVNITLQPQDKEPQCANEFIVRSTKVNCDLKTEHMTTSMFSKYMGNVVDEVNLDVVFDPLHTESEGIVPKAILGSSVFLDIYPLELRFLYEPNKLAACSLDLTNNTDEQVAFGLLKKSDEHMCFLSGLPMFGIVDPKTTYTLVVTTDRDINLHHERNIDLILQSTTCCRILSDRDICERHFESEEKLGNTVHKLTLRAVCALQGETTFEHTIPPSVKIISMYANPSYLHACINIDANQTEPLIITTTKYGCGYIWNYDTQKSMDYSKMMRASACSVKFIARMGWFLVGTQDGLIHVYSYKREIRRIASFKWTDNYYFYGQNSKKKKQNSKKDNYFYGKMSLAIHPTQSYVLSGCSTEIKLWDWDYEWDGWKCIQEFKEHTKAINAVMFNPEDYNSFASASGGGTIKVWSINSPKSKYTLSGHSGEVNCLDFFTRDGQQYFISGSDDKTAKIWDMQKTDCVCTLPHRSEVRFVVPHRSLPLLVTGTQGGHVHLWCSTNFRLKQILHIGGLSWFRDDSMVTGLVCLNESGRVVIGHVRRLSVIEISDEEKQGDSSGNNQKSISTTD